MVVLEALPLPKNAQLGAYDWHRDFPPLSTNEKPAYMWIFFCLTDTTPENGATWILPGSHRNFDLPQPRKGAVSANRPDGAIQLCAKAGDIAAINPHMFHAVGENQTTGHRRLLNIGLCRQDRRPLLNHWEIAKSGFSHPPADHVRALMTTKDWRLEKHWDVLPDGWPVHKPAGLSRKLHTLRLRADAALRRRFGKLL
jgi:ectoine hydroxylase-related dioxygenase (phytanoyl-CoA dioxygenase family)